MIFSKPKMSQICIRRFNITASELPIKAITAQAHP
jgi:hypothetical protein